MVRNVVGRWLGTAGLVVLMAATGSAQERGQGRGGFGFGGFGGGSKVGLIQNEQVQQELKLTDEQKSKVSEVATRVREAGPQRGQGGGQVDREQMRERMEAMSRVVAEEEKKLDEILNDEQKKRLDQISLQVTGVRALLRDEVASKLDLSDEQKEKVQAALRPQGGQGQRPDPAAMRERRAQMEQQVMAVLNDEQKQKWEELKGEAFELQRRGGPGGGQRRGGQGRGGQN